MKITVAAVAVWMAWAPADVPSPKPKPAECCLECKGTGMVTTGDGITRVQCPCPDSCVCAQNRPKARECTDGSCKR